MCLPSYSVLLLVYALRMKGKICVDSLQNQSKVSNWQSFTFKSHTLMQVEIEFQLTFCLLYTLHCSILFVNS